MSDWAGEPENADSENLHKVAEGNDIEFTGWGWPLPVPPGGCRLCACPPESMPMIFRGTGWCSDSHRKYLIAQSNNEGR